MSDMLLFKGEAVHALYKPCVALAGSPNSLILNTQKVGRVPRYYVTQHDSVCVNPLKVIGILLLLVTQTSV